MRNLDLSHCRVSECFPESHCSRLYLMDYAYQLKNAFRLLLLSAACLIASGDVIKMLGL